LHVVYNEKRGGFHHGCNSFEGLHFERKFRKQGKPIYRQQYERMET
jgi:hypothetical protein